jgi:hypothetical protein
MANEDVWVEIPLSSITESQYKIAVSIRELTQKTNEFSRKYVGGCSPSLQTSDPKRLTMHYNVKCSKTESDPKGHDVRVQFDVSKINESTTLNDLNVRFSCGCPAFLYWGAQWNLNRNKALEGPPRPLLQAPKEQLDKRRGFLLCKHCQVVANRIVPSVTRVINGITNKLRLEEIRKNKEMQRNEQDSMQQLQKQKKQLEQPVAPITKTPPKPNPKPVPSQKELKNDGLSGVKQKGVIR